PPMLPEFCPQPQIPLHTHSNCWKLQGRGEWIPEDTTGARHRRKKGFAMHCCHKTRNWPYLYHKPAIHPPERKWLIGKQNPFAESIPLYLMKLYLKLCCCADCRFQSQPEQRL